MRLRNVVLVLLVPVALAAAGCATNKTRQVDYQANIEQKNQEVVELQQSLERLESDLAVKESELEATAAAAAEAERRANQAEQEVTDASAEPVGEAVPSDQLLPNDAKAGECYARVFVPPTYRNSTERVLKREASERVEVVPAGYDWGEEQVLVQEASERIEVVPATYKWVEERVLVKEASTRLEEVPAVYDQVEEKLLVEPAHKVWKKGRGPIEKVDNATGEIMCLVEVPARYETVHRKVLKTPARVREIEIPAEYKTIKKQVVDKPATTRKMEIPAKFQTVKINKMVSPPEQRRIEIPAEYDAVTKTEQVTGGRIEWRPVLCETNMSAGVMSQLQRALKAAGKDPGPIDGIYGPLTAAAVRSYQQANGLATGGLTLTTLEELGVRM